MTLEPLHDMLQKAAGDHAGDDMEPSGVAMYSDLFVKADRHASELRRLALNPSLPSNLTVAEMCLYYEAVRLKPMAGSSMHLPLGNDTSVG